MLSKSKIKYIIGIDEVGRGPLAGPVAVCALALRRGTQGRTFFPIQGSTLGTFRDSKKLSHGQRLKWLEKINEEKKKGNISYKVSFESNKIIDKKGLSFSIKDALKKALQDLDIKPQHCLVLLDGGLKAPMEYSNQKTIIKGDEKELVIALASIAAKVARDSLMIKLARKYPGYGLEIHKGYGTKAHFQAIKKYGISAIHRQCFLKNLDRK
ncbi:MAG: ribonuclease HII [bacterium]